MRNHVLAGRDCAFRDTGEQCRTATYRKVRGSVGEQDADSSDYSEHTFQGSHLSTDEKTAKAAMMSAAENVGANFARQHAAHLDRVLSAFTGFLAPADRKDSELTEAVWVAYLSHLVVHVSAQLSLPADVVAEQLVRSVRELKDKDHAH
jgi:hypothetical protein